MLFYVRDTCAFVEYLLCAGVCCFVPETKSSISRKLKAAREVAKRKASDQREKNLHESMQNVSEPSVEFSILSSLLSILSSAGRYTNLPPYDENSYR